MAIWALLIMMVAEQVIGVLLQPKINHKASELLVPQLGEGQSVPIVCGTVALAPSVLWYGDVDPQEQHGGIFGISDTGVAEWYARMHFLVCWGPVDEWLDILIDGKSVKLQHASDFPKPAIVPGVTKPFTPEFPLTRPLDGQPTKGYMACTDLFGGYLRGGGVGGAVEFAWGTDEQAVLSLVHQKYVLNDRFGVPYHVDARYPRWCHLSLGLASDANPGIAGAMYNSFYFGESPFPVPMQVVVRVCQNPAALGLVAGEHNIGGFGNFACLLYHLLTDPDQGLGFLENTLEPSTFAACARTLASEGLGCSIVIANVQAARGYLEDLLSHVDGLLRRNPATGLLEMKLARADYDLSTLQHFTSSNTRAVKIDWGSWPETRNNILVTFNEMVISDTATTTRVDPPSSPADGDRYLVGVGATGVWVGQDGKVARWTAVGNQWEFFATDAFVGARAAIRASQDLANRFATGGVRTATYDRPYFGTGAAAQLAADRYRRALASPIAKVSGTINREGALCRVGDVVVLDLPEDGIEGLVVRLVDLDYGTPTDGGIKFDAIQDVFGIGAAVYRQPPPSVWQDPVPTPTDLIAKTLFEMPFWMTPGRDGSRRVAILAAKEKLGYRALDVELSIDGGDFYRSNTEQPFAIAGALAADYAYTTEGVDETGFTVVDAGGLDALLGLSTDDGGLVRGDRIALIANPDQLELITWRTALNNFDGTWTITGVVRAILDTVPPLAAHPLGTTVYFFWPDRMAAVTPDAFMADVSLEAKALPSSAKGTLDPAAATSVSGTTVSRAQAPYPAARPRLAATGSYDLFTWPILTVGGSGLVLSWSQRSRTGQSTIVRQDATDQAPLEGTYTVEVLLNGVVARTVTGITGDSYIYTPSMRAADSTDGTKAVSFRVTPVHDGLDGSPLMTPSVVMTGFGMCFGTFFGGIES